MTETLVYLVRHAEAGDRAAWRRPDPVRPLTDTGRLQADALVELFAGRPLVQVVSSPFTRCLETLAPLATARELPIEVRDELAEGMPWEFGEKLVLEAAAEGPAAICVHGDPMRYLIADLAERGVPLSGDVGDHAKGATWVLRVRDGVIVSGRYVPPPIGP